MEVQRATVTQVSPLKVRIDTAATASSAESMTNLGTVIVGMRVIVTKIGKSLLVLGAQ